MAELVGIVRAPLASLHFSAVPRQLDHAVVDKLVRLFTKTPCEPRRPENHIPAVIDQEEFERILQTLHLSADQLRETLESDDFPLLPEQKISCLHGQHRVAAATITCGKSASWVVKLYRAEGSDPLFQNLVESFSYESPFSDGEVYRMIRNYMRKYDEAGVKRWRTRLTPCKERSLNILLGRWQIVEAFDGLLKFPGLLGGLQLGNIHKHLALHCDEHITQYLRHVRLIWERITNGHPEIADLESVQRLQLRAPKRSAADKLSIQQMFEDRVLFPEVMHLDVREGIKKTILALDVVIPSVQTFHENMKYIGLGAGILKRFLQDDAPKKTPKAQRPSLFEGLCANWQERPLHLQLNEQDFRLCQGSRPHQELAYIEIFMMALRLFPYLCSESPRQDERDKPLPALVKNGCISYLAERAYLLGFNSNKIDQWRACPEQYEHPHSPTDMEVLADWRCGRPFVGTWSVIMRDGFLPNLAKAIPSEDRPSPSFILKDMLIAFFSLGCLDLRVVPTSEDEDMADMPDQTHGSPDVNEFDWETQEPNVELFYPAHGLDRDMHEQPEGSEDVSNNSNNQARIGKGKALARLKKAQSTLNPRSRRIRRDRQIKITKPEIRGNTPALDSRAKAIQSPNMNPGFASRDATRSVIHFDERPGPDMASGSALTSMGNNNLSGDIPGRDLEARSIISLRMSDMQGRTPAVRPIRGMKGQRQVLAGGTAQVPATAQVPLGELVPSARKRPLQLNPDTEISVNPRRFGVQVVKRPMLSREAPEPSGLEQLPSTFRRTPLYLDWASTEHPPIFQASTERPAIPRRSDSVDTEL